MHAPRMRRACAVHAPCMRQVGVDEEKLNLPMSISVLSGNGSFSIYENLFEAKRHPRRDGRAARRQRARAPGQPGRPGGGGGALW